jgi:hypothetical protein
MPIGICGDPGRFQNLMNDTFAASISEHDRTLSFHELLGLDLGDICLHSRIRAEHPLRLRAVLLRLRERNLYAKPNECEWIRITIDLFGQTLRPMGL